ncbi:MAG: hypothetical protein AB7U73_07910 [Pirellulales bacterium]
MSRSSGTHRRRNVLRCFAALGALALAVPRDAAAEQRAPRFDTEPRALDRIPAGTVVGDSAPRDWDALIIKSKPRVTQGDVNQVMQVVKQNASLLTTIILAARRQNGPGAAHPYSLDRVAVGLGVTVQGGQQIVNSEKPGNLGLIERQVLNGAERNMDSALLIAQSSGMAIVDFRAIVRRGVEHVDSILRYAVMVDNRNGQFFTLAWQVELDTAGNYAQAPAEVQWLPRNMVEDNPLFVDASKFTLGIPNTRAFAVAKLPTGRPVALTPRIRALAALPRFTEQSLYELEVGLWQAIYAPVSTAPAAARYERPATLEAN